MAKRNERKVTTNPVRLSYANIAEARKMSEEADPKYSTAILIPKTDTETIKLINEAFKLAAQDSTIWKGKVPANLKTTLRDGDEEHPDREEYAGMMFMTISNKKKPTLLDKKRQAADPEEFYSGCWACVQLQTFAYNTNGNKGVSASLLALQKVRDDDLLGGGGADVDAFDDSWGDEDEDDFPL